MKIICAHLLEISSNNQKINAIKSEFNLNFVGFFARPSTKELLNFFVCQMAKDNYVNQNNLNDINKNINEKKILTILHPETNNYLSMMKKDNIILSIMYDSEYPKRTIVQLLVDSLNSTNQINKIDLHYLVFECDDPSKIDNFMKINKKLDMISSIMLESLELTKERQQQLDQIIETTDELSKISKEFYDKSKKLNSCCWTF